MTSINKHHSLTTLISSITLLFLLHLRPTTAVKGGYWSPDSGLPASAIDSTLFTHLFCAFANLNTQTYQLTLQPGCSTFPKTIKQRNPSVKSLLSIGGGNAQSSDFNSMARQPNTRKTFIDSAIGLAVANGYDGLDLDWEQQLTQEEMNNLGTLLAEWRAAIKAQAPALLLTAALRFTAQAWTGVPFPAQAISNNLDWVNLMAYDFYAPAWSPKPYLTRPHANLRDPTGGIGGSSGVNAWINAGVPARKLVLGFPFYGYAWKLVDPNKNGILAPASGGDGSIGDNGTVMYKEIRDFIRQRGATVVYNGSYVTNYCYAGNTWIAYDDLQSISAGYVKSINLLGYFAWNIVQDSNWALSKQASQTWGVQRTTI